MAAHLDVRGAIPFSLTRSQCKCPLQRGPGLQIKWALLHVTQSVCCLQHLPTGKLLGLSWILLSPPPGPSVSLRILSQQTLPPSTCVPAASSARLTCRLTCPSRGHVLPRTAPSSSAHLRSATQLPLRSHRFPKTTRYLPGGTIQRPFPSSGPTQLLPSLSLPRRISRAQFHPRLEGFVFAGWSNNSLSSDRITNSLFSWNAPFHVAFSPVGPLTNVSLSPSFPFYYHLFLLLLFFNDSWFSNHRPMWYTVLPTTVVAVLRHGSGETTEERRGRRSFEHGPCCRSWAAATGLPGGRTAGRAASCPPGEAPPLVWAGPAGAGTTERRPPGKCRPRYVTGMRHHRGGGPHLPHK